MGGWGGVKSDFSVMSIFENFLTHGHKTDPELENKSFFLQESGIFEEVEWDLYECVLRKFSLMKKLCYVFYSLATTTECYDCTTTTPTSKHIHLFYKVQKSFNDICLFSLHT